MFSGMSGIESALVSNIARLRDHRVSAPGGNDASTAARSASSCIGQGAGLNSAAPAGRDGTVGGRPASTNGLARTIGTLQVGRKPRLNPICTTMLPVVAPLVMARSGAKSSASGEKDVVAGFSTGRPARGGGGQGMPVLVVQMTELRVQGKVARQVSSAPPMPSSAVVKYRQSRALPSGSAPAPGAPVPGPHSGTGVRAGGGVGGGVGARVSFFAAIFFAV